MITRNHGVNSRFTLFRTDSAEHTMRRGERVLNIGEITLTLRKCRQLRVPMPTSTFLNTNFNYMVFSFGPANSFRRWHYRQFVPSPWNLRRFVDYTATSKGPDGNTAALYCSWELSPALSLRLHACRQISHVIAKLLELRINLEYEKMKSFVRFILQRPFVTWD